MKISPFRTKIYLLDRRRQAVKLINGNVKERSVPITFRDVTVEFVDVDNRIFRMPVTLSKLQLPILKVWR
jgi:hypothetical protein